MGHKVDNQHKEYRRKPRQKEDSFEGADNSSVIGILKRMQQQMAFLERKVDHLTNLLENKPDKESYHSKFSEEGQRAYHGSKERKFAPGYSKGEDSQSGGRPKEKTPAFGKSFGKFFGKRSVDKKKSFSVKKSVGKYHYAAQINSPHTA